MKIARQVLPGKLEGKDQSRQGRLERIGISQVAATENYILHQEKHHSKRALPRSGQTFLRRHGLLSIPSDLSRPWRD
jgi:hypothetical protein